MLLRAAPHRSLPKLSFSSPRASSRLHSASPRASLAYSLSGAWMVWQRVGGGSSSSSSSSSSSTKKDVDQSAAEHMRSCGGCSSCAMHKHGQ
uniref:Uncharacterized protein n=1 Tax=Tetradesmus obliquus TaxID=3088 RepID=A0A383W6Y0_TETOB